MSLTEELKEYAERLAQSPAPNPEVSTMMLRAANKITELEKIIAEMKEDNIIAIIDEDGEEIMRLDEETSQTVTAMAVSEFLHEAMAALIRESEEL